MSDGPADVPISRLFYDDAGPHVLGRAPAAPAAQDATRVAPRVTPARGRELHELLGASIAQLGGVSGAVRRTPQRIQTPVPIETLLYRGRSALERAREIGSHARRRREPLPSETLEELLDLVELAATE